MAMIHSTQGKFISNKEEKLQFKTLENNMILMTAKEEVKDRKEWQDLSEENKGRTKPNLKARILKY